jgi:hypothetical protein
MAFETTRQEILKQAIELKKLYDSTRIESYKDQELRLRRIVVELDNLTLGTSDLNSLTDVTISSPTNGQVLAYNSTTSQWENQAGGGSGYVPYTGATGDVNLGTHQLLAARGTFSNNGSTNTLTVDHTSGSGYGIIVTKGGANEALYVNKTSGSGNAMTVVGGRTSLVDLALSSVSNAAGDFLTLSGGVVHRRTAAQVLSDISVPTPTLAQVTTAGNTTTNAITVGGLTVATNLIYTDLVNNRVGIGTTSPSQPLHVVGRTRIANSIGTSLHLYNDGTTSLIDSLTSGNAAHDLRISAQNISFYSGSSYGTVYAKLFNTGNFALGSNPTDAGYKLDVDGTVRVKGNIYLTDQMNRYIYGFGGTYIKFYDSGTGGLDIYNVSGTGGTRNYGPLEVYGNFTTTGSFSMNGNLNIGNGNFLAADTSSYNRIYPYNGANAHMRFILGHPTAGDFDWEYPINTVLVRLKRNGNFLIGTTTDAGYKLDVNGTARVQGAFTATLANVSTANVVYYNSSTGLMTYATAPVGAQFKIDYDPNITGTKNGSNLLFTTSSTFIATTTRVFLNGQRLTRGATYDYVETGTNQITFAVAPVSTDQLIIEYQI